MRWSGAMRSNRLALTAVLAGAALLGFSSRGVIAIGARVPTTSTTVVVHRDHPDRMSSARPQPVDGE